MPAVIKQKHLSSEEEKNLLPIIFEPGEVDQFGFDIDPVLLPQYAHLQKEWDEQAARAYDAYMANPSNVRTFDEVMENLAQKTGHQRIAR